MPARHRAVAVVTQAALTIVVATAAPAVRTAESTPPAASAPLPEASASAVDPALQRRFTAWIAAFRDEARGAGIREATLRAAFDGVQYLPRVIELDRAQPEFVRPVWDYLDLVASPQRITRGREKLQAVQTQAEQAAARFGVPAPVLVAIWGVETLYGERLGTTPTIDALATLAFDGRREAWARGELIAALRILQRGDIERAQMVGSWAGAIGHTQFIPSSFLAYAVDADGDGRRDLWSSVADALASSAHLLARAGWRSGEPWGIEVQLPKDFDAGRADPQRRQSSARWAAEGVRGTDGSSTLPALADAALLQPAGARGPAFLVGTNFRALLRYNNAVSYALAVGLLAQGIDGGAGVQAAWPRELQPLSRTQMLALQRALVAKGFDIGTPDGIAGPATREALRRWQRRQGQLADGYPTLELLQQLQGE